MMLAVPPGFLRDEGSALIGCDWLQERGVPLADVLLWYARLEGPEGPPTVLVGAYSGRLTADAGRAARVRRHGLGRQGVTALGGAWVLTRPGAPEAAYGPADGDLARRELRRRVLALFPEVGVVLPCPRCDGGGRTAGPPLGGTPAAARSDGCLACAGRRVVTVRAPDLVPPEPDTLFDRLAPSLGVPPHLFRPAASPPPGPAP